MIHQSPPGTPSGKGHSNILSLHVVFGCLYRLRKQSFGWDVAMTSCRVRIVRTLCRSSRLHDHYYHPTCMNNALLIMYSSTHAILGTDISIHN